MSNRDLVLDLLNASATYLTVDEVVEKLDGELDRKQVGNAISQMKNVVKVEKNSNKKWMYGVVEDEDMEVKPNSPKLNTLKQILGPIAELEADKQKAINTLVKLNKIINTALEELNGE